jgi:hypothetical protein
MVETKKINPITFSKIGQVNFCRLYAVPTKLIPKEKKGYKKGQEKH